jgi:replicative DNA helicase
VPFDLPAERAVLACLLQDGDQMAAVVDWLEPARFYLEKHGLIYAAARACYQRREAVTMPTVAAELRRHDQLDLVGGFSFLGEIAAESVAPNLIRDYARPVENAAVRRGLIEVGGQITATGFDESLDLEVALDQSEAALFAVSQRRQRESEMGADLADAVGPWWERVARLQDGAEVAGIATGWRDLDARLLLRKAQMHIFAARPGVGKSALALALTRSVARDGAAVDYYSLEMDRNLLQDRLYAMEAGISADLIQRGRLRDDQLNILGAAAGRCAEWRIHICDRFALSHLGLRAYARRRHTAARPDLIIVDHIGLLTPPKAENRNVAVGEISRGFVHLALELDVPIVALSQLNREVEGRAVKVPQLSDLRDSGSLEQDAASVTFLHRPGLYDRQKSLGLMELHNAKNRNGATAWQVNLDFDPQTMRLRSEETRYQEVEGYAA